MRYYTHKDYYECPQHSLFAMTKGHPFGRLVVSAADYLRRRVPEVSVLVFLMSGSIRILRNNAREKEISSGSMILLPKFACAYGTALTDCEFFIVKVHDGTEDYDIPYLTSLPSELPDDFVYDFDTLPILPIIEGYVRLFLLASETAGLLTAEFFNVKRRELLCYMKTCYSRKEMAAFLYPILGGRLQSFKNMVLSNYTRFRTLNDFAREAGMSLSTFQRKFKETFGVTAYKWMNERKSEMVYKDILTTDMTFSEIADKYGFSSSAYLVSFCRRHFGKLPGDIRVTGGGALYNDRID